MKIEDIHMSYGAIEVVHGVTMEVPDGEIVALLGANGAGKSTCLRTIAGLKAPSSGKIIFKGEDISGKKAHLIAKKGLSLVPEGRHVFAGMTVYENLQLAASGTKHLADLKENVKEVYELFPRLEERKDQLGWSLSGGEQQMLAIARAMVCKADLIMFDEASLGLAPNLVQEVMRAIIRLNRQGISVLLVEQDANLAMAVAKRAYVLGSGRVVLEGLTKDLKNDPKLKQAYLGQI